MSSIDETNQNIYTITKKYNQVFRCETDLAPKNYDNENPNIRILTNLYIDMRTTIDNLDLVWNIRYVYQHPLSTAFHSPWGIIITPPREIKSIGYDVHFKVISKTPEGERFILMNSEEYSKSFESFASFVNLLNVIVVEIHFTEVHGTTGEIIDDYANFFEKKDSCDVVFIFGDQELLAHRQILSARNAVFASMFESDMMEKINGRVEIIDIEQEIFKHLLYFIYCGKVVCSSAEDLLKLMIAADKYGAIDLVQICTNKIFLEKKLTVENVINALVTADQLNLNDFKNKCMELILNNKSIVTKTESYQNLVKSRGDLISELFCAR